MTQADPPPPQPLFSNKGLAVIVYVLYLIIPFTGLLSGVIGVIIAHVQYGSGDPVLDSHYQFQIRTFWVSVLYVAVATILFFTFVGIVLAIPVFIWWLIWALVRNIKGLLLLNEGRPIPNPSSWLFS
jgi:uncharacterized membrane protein